MKDTPQWDPALNPSVEDRRNEVPQWDMARLLDSRPVAEGVWPRDTGAGFNAQEVPFPESYGQLSRDAGNDDVSNLMMSHLINLLGAGKIASPKDFRGK